MKLSNIKENDFIIRTEMAIQENCHNIRYIYMYIVYLVNLSTRVSLSFRRVHHLFIYL